MDTEAVPFDEFRECLRHLERINRASLAYRPTLAWLGRLVRRHPGRPLSILDVGFGHGDMLRRISGWAAERGVPVRLAGVDLVPWSARPDPVPPPPDAALSYHLRLTLHRPAP